MRRILVTLLVASLCGLIRAYGGFESILAFIRRVFRGKRGGQLGIGLLVGLMDIATANNTVAIILTGGLANSKKLTGMVIDYLHNLVKVVVIPGENEMEALAQGGLRILDGREQVHIFRPACALTT